MTSYNVRLVGAKHSADVIAADHRAAFHAVRSLLDSPPYTVIVSGDSTVVRFAVDSRGRVHEESRYTAHVVSEEQRIAEHTAFVAKLYRTR